MSSAGPVFPLRISFESSYEEITTKRIFLTSALGGRIAEVCVSDAYRRGVTPWSDEPVAPYVDALLSAGRRIAKGTAE